MKQETKTFAAELERNMIEVLQVVKTTDGKYFNESRDGIVKSMQNILDVAVSMSRITEYAIVCDDRNNHKEDDLVLDVYFKVSTEKEFIVTTCIIEQLNEGIA